MQKNYVIAIIGLCVVLYIVNEAKQEYQRIQTRIELTQAKIDRVAEESAIAIKGMRQLLESIIGKFSKELDNRAELIENTLSSEVYRLKQEIDAKPGKDEIQVKQAVSEVVATERAIQPSVPTEQPAEPKSEPKVESKPVPTIVMHSGYSCGPCNAWIANDKAKWEGAGWIVDVRKELESTRGWPWYEITDRDGKRFEVDGPLTREKFNEAKKGNR